MIFTVEETALVSSFDHSNRNVALLKMAAHLKLIEDAELKELTRRTVRKLNKLTDAEFASIDFTVYDNDEEADAFTKTATKEITSTKRKMETARTNCWRLFLSPFLPSEKPFASIIFFDFSMGVSDIFIMASPPESYNAPIICMIAKETKEKPVENLKDSEHVQVKHIGSAFLKRQASYR